MTMKKTPDCLPSFHSSKFSARLKQVRISAGYTQKELAALLGISRETISAVENNKKNTMDSFPAQKMTDWFNACASKSSQANNDMFIHTWLRFLKITK